MIIIKRILVFMFLFLALAIFLGFLAFFGFWYIDDAPPNITAAVDLKNRQNVEARFSDYSLISFYEVYRNERRIDMGYIGGFRRFWFQTLKRPLALGEELTFVATDRSRSRNTGVLKLKVQKEKILTRTEKLTPHNKKKLLPFSSVFGKGGAVEIRLSDEILRYGDLAYFYVHSNTPVDRKFRFHSEAVKLVALRLDNDRFFSGCFLTPGAGKDGLFLPLSFVLYGEEKRLTPRIYNARVQLPPRFKKYPFKPLAPDARTFAYKAVPSAKSLIRYSAPPVLPCSGKIDVPYGALINYKSGGRFRNPGICFFRSRRRPLPVKTPFGGKVTFLHRSKNGDVFVKIHHGNQFESFFAFLTTASVKEGQAVLDGQIIGGSRNDYIHWAFAVHGVFVNPETIFSIDFKVFFVEG